MTPIQLIVLSAFVASGLIGSVFAVKWLIGGGFAEAAGIVQALVTVWAICVAGIYALYKLEVFREFQPHLSINQSISDRRISPKYTHLAVTAQLKNTSKVAIEIRQSMFRVQQIAPLTDEDVEVLYKDYSLNQDSENYILWPTYNEIKNTWAPGSFAIEQG